MEVINEYRPLVELDKDGSVIINHNVDLKKEYDISHKLVMQYLDDKNNGGLMFESARLYYLSLLVDKELNRKINFKNKTKMKEYKDLKSNILNDFNRCLKALPDDFNFGEYYATSEFNNNSTVISANTIKGISHLIKNLLG